MGGIVNRVTKSQTRLSDFQFTSLHFIGKQINWAKDPAADLVTPLGKET